MNTFLVTPVVLLLLSIVIIAQLRAKKHLHQIERVAVFILFSSVLSDFTIVVSLNYQLWDIGVERPQAYALNLVNRYITYPAMCVLFINEYAGKTRVWERVLIFIKWWAIYFGVAQLFGKLELVRYVNWTWQWSASEWFAQLFLAVAFFTLFRYLLKRGLGLQQEVTR